MKKIFIVGTPRSGTTLTQAILQQHPDVYTLPETHFIEKLRRTKEIRILRLLDFYKLKKSNIINAYQHLLEVSNCDLSIDKGILYKANTLSKGVQLMDTILTGLAKEANKTIWAEKSPEHIFYINLIEKNINDLKFIHVIRDGRDVVASIYDASLKYKKVWGWCADIDKCINLYNNSIKQSKQYINADNHYFLFYDNLVLDPEEEIKKLYHFLGINNYIFDFSNFNSGNTAIVHPREQWKMEVTTGIQNRTLMKFKKIFTKTQQEYIEKHIVSLDTSFLK